MGECIRVVAVPTRLAVVYAAKSVSRCWSTMRLACSHYHRRLQHHLDRFMIASLLSASILNVK